MTSMAEQAAEREPLEATAQALDEALARIAELDEPAQEAAGRAMDALNAIHKGGLVAVVRRLRDDKRGKDLLFELVDDPAVRMVLMMHGIIRSDPATLARQSLDRVRPALRSHGGDAELVEVADGVARIRLTGACDGCSMSSVTLRESVESALFSGVPGLTAVEVVPAALAPADHAPTLIPLSAVGVGAPARSEPTDPGETGWFKTFPVERIPVGTLEAMSLAPADGGESVEVIVVNTGRLAAYVNSCAHQGLPLDNALVDVTEGTITCPWHGLCYDAADGVCLTMPGAQLDPLPLRVDDGHIWVRSSAS